MSDETATIGDDELGPVFEWFLYRLDNQIQVAFERDALVLFAARAGVRLHELYLDYLAQRDRIPDGDMAVLWSSRLLACKGFANRAPRAVNNQFHANYRHGTIADLLTGLTRHEPAVEARIDWEDPNLERPATEFDVTNLPHLLGARNADILGRYFDSYAALTDNYLAQLGYDGHRPIILVDSGWRGSMHELFSAGLAPGSVESLYVGVMDLDDDQPIPPGVTGLVLDQRSRSGYPEDAIGQYRHLIEGVLEANTESAETLAVDGAEVICGQAKPDVPDPRQGLDGLYLAVRDSIRTADRRGSAELSSRFEQGAKALAERLLRPTPSDIEQLGAGSRSADFGRKIGMPVPIPAEDRHDYDSPDRRIVDSLWPQAQAVVEFGTERGADVQRQLNAYVEADDYFLHRTATDPSDTSGDRPLILICTRTKDRPVLLERAAASVAEQTYDNYLWVVVNDGGDVGRVDEVIGKCGVDPSKIRLVSHTRSQGMEAASNAGISHAPSDLVIIHDDDDSWQPTFLETAVDYLTSDKGREYGGVVLGTIRVDEIIRGDEIKITRTSEYNPFLTSVELIEMLIGNLFPPISFVFRRSIYDDIGGYDETLPVLGDWDFNIRVLQRADIGVVRDKLANYHHREPGTSVNYSNSVVAGSDLHAEFRTRLIHRYMRGAAGPELASYLVQSQMLGRLRWQDQQVSTPQTGQPDLGGSLLWSWVALQWLLEGSGDPLEESAKSAGYGPNRRQADLIERAMKDDDFLRRVSPPDGFHEQDYLDANPDVKSAVGVGQFGSGFEHYLRHGLGEGRQLRS